jgi:arylsulfatase A-like enzyme
VRGRTWIPLLAGVALAVAALGVWSSRPGPVGRPNVLIVLWDTARADRMSLYGHSRATTPFLERFAEDARVWEHAIASSEWTAHTHASLFTGLPLRTHGMDTYYTWLDHGHLTLAEHLAEAGWDTYAFTGNRFVSDHVNMLQGFRVQDHTYRGRWKAAAARSTREKLLPRDKSTEISPGWTPDGHGQGWSKKLTLYKDAAPVAHEAFASWLDGERDPSKPFFAFINLMEAHTPRIPSLASRKALMDRETFELALVTDHTLFAHMSYISGKREYTELELDAMRATYDAALLDLDRAAEALMGDLEARGLLDDTVVVFTADHGELLGEHHMVSHRWALYEPLIHVPLLVRYPKGMPAGRVAESVSVTQVAGTITGLLGLPAMPGASPGLLETPGLPRIVSELRDPNRVMDVVLDAFPDVKPDQFMRSLAAVMDGELKLIRASDGAHRLHDLHADPGESTNLAGDRPADVERMLEVLAHWERATPAYDPATATAADKPEPSGEEADPDQRRMLEVLGYTEDERPPP